MCKSIKLFSLITVIALLQITQAYGQSGGGTIPTEHSDTEDNRDDDYQSSNHDDAQPSRSVLKGEVPEGSNFPFEKELLGLFKDMFTDGSDRLKTIMDKQQSYDYNAGLSTINLLKKSGFLYDIFNVTSVDGYITQLIRVKHPHVGDYGHRTPPVVLYAGQGYSPGIFVATSLSREPSSENVEGDAGDGIRLGNRSLVWNLVNNGFDVWLIPARGVDQANLDRDERVHRESRSSVPSQARSLGMSPLGQNQEPAETNPIQLILDNFKKFVHSISHLDYWSFSNDEIISLEFKRQLELILEVTSVEKLTLIDYSNGAFVSYAFMASDPNFASKHIGAHISIAPAVYVNKYNIALGASNLLSYLNLPGFSYPSAGVDLLIRGKLVQICKSKLTRYTICKWLLNVVYGQSETLETSLELILFDYIGRPMSPRALQQMLQASHGGKLRHYDHLAIGNIMEYHSLTPPAYDLSKAVCQNRYIITGDRDAIVDRRSVGALMSELSGREVHIEVPGYNHLDMLAGGDVATKVHLPILKIMSELNDHHSSDARSVNKLPTGIATSPETRLATKTEEIKRGPTTKQRQFDKPPASVTKTEIGTKEPTMKAPMGRGAATSRPLKIKYVPATIIPRK